MRSTIAGMAVVAVWATLQINCTVLFVAESEPVPEPSIQYLFASYSDGYDGIVENSGSAGPEGPSLYLGDNVVVMGGRLQCPGDDKCGQTDRTEILRPCLQARALSIVAKLQSTRPQVGSSTNRPQHEIVRILTYDSEGSGDNILKVGLDEHEDHFQYVASIYDAERNPTLAYVGAEHVDQPIESHHMVFVLDGASAQFYINGVAQIAAFEGAPAIHSSGMEWKLKIGDESNELWSGNLKNLSLYCSALSSKQVAALYDAAK